MNNGWVLFSFSSWDRLLGTIRKAFSTQFINSSVFRFSNSVTKNYSIEACWNRIFARDICTCKVSTYFKIVFVGSFCNILFWKFKFQMCSFRESHVYDAFRDIFVFTSWLGYVSMLMEDNLNSKFVTLSRPVFGLNASLLRQCLVTSITLLLLI